MLIGIDASRANKKNRTGVEWYSYHLIEEFKKIDQHNRYFLYTNKPLEGALKICPPAFASHGVASAGKSNFEEKVLSWPVPRSWTIGRLSWEMKFGQEIPDVLFVPAHTLPLFNPKRSLVTIHDLGFEHFPKAYHWADKLYHKLIINIIKRGATKIIAVSEFTKQDLISTYHIPADKIKVIHNGYDANRFKPDKSLPPKTVGGSYVLFVGRLEEKKNVQRLVEAFSIFKTKHSENKHKLVLAGRPGFGFEKIKLAIEQSGFQDEIILTGWVDDDELATLYANADLFFFPSLFEGFGIPVIEAMASGCPVICSGTTSLPEVVGSAALTFPPKNVNEMADCIEKVLLNADLSASLREKGLERAKQFSWRKCAEETLAVLTETF